MHPRRLCLWPYSNETLAAGVAILVALSICPVSALDNNREQRPRGIAEILSGPLPGTAAHIDQDAARGVEATLSGLDGVERARVIITTDPDLPQPASRTAAVKIELDRPPPSRDWVSNVAAFIIRAVPGLTDPNLTIIDTTGTKLYADGNPVDLAHVSPTNTTSSPRRQVSMQGAYMLATGIGGAGIVAALVLVKRRNREDSEHFPEPSGPFSFLRHLSDDDLRRMLEAERPAVVAAVIQLAPEDEAARLRDCCDLTELPVLQRLSSEETIDALENALRAKLVSG